MKGKIQPNSGAGYFKKGDVALNNFLIEAKTQMQRKKSFSIKEEWIEKAKEEAFGQGKNYFALAFNFGGEKNIENYYVIDSDTFQLFISLLEEING